MSISKLRRVQKCLEPVLEPWTFRVITQREVERDEYLDPPIAVMRATWGPYELNLHGDGEVTLAFLWHGEAANYVWPKWQFDMSKSPAEIAVELLDAIGHAMEDTQ